MDNNKNIKQADISLENPNKNFNDENLEKDFYMDLIREQNEQI